MKVDEKEKELIVDIKKIIKENGGGEKEFKEIEDILLNFTELTEEDIKKLIGGDINGN